ncbi:MAG: metallophosphoesterase [Deltaproteobacteria bacterium]|nr:MAG: metallophosphoesterase [Deltaproteobacteria bacterium]
MKIVAISDTHLEYLKMDIPDGDVFIHAGDIDVYDASGLSMFNGWLGKLPHKHKLVIGGNHDSFLVGNYNLVQAMLTNAKYLENEQYIIDGVKFWGSPITPTFNDWHFMADRGDDIKQYWDMIPDETDVLITHGPPQGIMDVPSLPSGNKGEHVGCWDLMQAINRVKPKVHLFGHIHEQKDTQFKHGVWFYNVGVLDEYYVLTEKATVIDLC